ncbi:MAG: hypothetical protein ACRDZ4_20415 [Egibacteraceae bacterium]
MALRGYPPAAQGREEHDLDVIFDLRAWPLELVNERGTPRRIVEPEAAVLANHETELFSKFNGESWPSTFLPAVRARRGGAAPARLPRSRGHRLPPAAAVLPPCRRGELTPRAAQAVIDAGLDADAVLDVWESQPVRTDVLADFTRSKELPIKGSPQVFWPDGSVAHNPVLQREVIRSIPRIVHDGPEEPDRPLRETLRTCLRTAALPRGRSEAERDFGGPCRRNCLKYNKNIR